MKITARMIADKLEELLILAKIPDEASQRYDFVKVLLPEIHQIEQGHACIVPGEQMPSLVKPAASCLVITQQPIELDWPCPVLFCRGNINDIYEAVLNVFAQYNALENELKDGLLNDWDLPRMLIPLARFFANPVQVYAPIFKAVASVKPLIGSDGRVIGTANYEQNISAEIVHGMLRSSDLREDIKSENAKYRRYPVFDCGCYQVNLISHDQLIGRLVMIEENGTFSIGGADTLNEVARYIRHMMIHRRSPVYASLFTVDYSITEIISGRITDSQVIEALMSTFFAIHPGSVQYCLFLSGFAGYSHSGCHQLSCPGFRRSDAASRSSSARGRNCRLMPHQIPDAGILEDSLEPYLSTTDIYAGLGESFSDFHNARTSYLQAKAAVRFGIESSAAAISSIIRTTRLTIWSMSSSTRAMASHLSIPASIASPCMISKTRPSC
jgi:hypothetical protein